MIRALASFALVLVVVTGVQLPADEKDDPENNPCAMGMAKEPQAPNCPGSGQGSSPSRDGRSICRDGKSGTYEDFRFLSAAHFPLPGFGPRGEVANRDGAVIYEGMRFSADCKGCYEVSFLAGTGAMRTTLRLQFQVLTERDGQPRWTTVTLPPITIDPNSKAGDQTEAGIHHVRHCGYSPSLEQGRICEVRREGTARFGHGPSGLGQKASE